MSTGLSLSVRFLLIILSIDFVIYSSFIEAADESKSKRAIEKKNSEFAAPVAQNRGRLYQVSVPPRKEDAYENAYFRLWVPDHVKKIRGVIVRQHGCGAGARKYGLEHADDLQWQALARKWNCALLGTQIWAPKEECSTWYMPADGSEHAFFSALQKLGKQSHHPEIAKAPWCLWGHSGGALWVMNMLYRNPERVIAVFPRSGGLAPVNRELPLSQPLKPNSNPVVYDVPVMFCYGEKENQPGERFYAAVVGTHDVFDVAREKQAQWSVAEHPGSSHENSNSRLLAIRFFDSMLERRLPKDASSTKLKKLDYQQGWFGDLKSKAVQSIKQNRVDDSKRQAWLPNEKVAAAWRELVKTGRILDTSPPTAPLAVQVSSVPDKGVKLEWQAEADLESGIHAFRIYRDGKMIGTVQGHRNQRWNPESHFHAWNYSDQPIYDDHAAHKMEFLDATKEASPQANYEVSTVNQAGLESPKTAGNK